MPNVKNIGKPYAGKPHVRFDEGGQEKLTMVRLLRHRQTKGAVTDRLGLTFMIRWCITPDYEI